MVWLIGILGFLCGFMFALMALNYMLRDRSKTELLNSRGLRWRYGLFTWLVAGLAAYAAIRLYKIYFPVF